MKTQKATPTAGKTQPEHKRCRVDQLSQHLDSEDYKTLLEVLANPNVSAAAISGILVSAGYVIKEDTLRRHRRGACLCLRTEATQ